MRLGWQPCCKNTFIVACFISSQDAIQFPCHDFLFTSPFKPSSHSSQPQTPHSPSFHSHSHSNPQIPHLCLFFIFQLGERRGSVAPRRTTLAPRRAAMVARRVSLDHRTPIPAPRDFRAQIPNPATGAPEFGVRIHSRHRCAVAAAQGFRGSG